MTDVTNYKELTEKSLQILRSIELWDLRINEDKAFIRSFQKDFKNKATRRHEFMQRKIEIREKLFREFTDIIGKIAFVSDKLNNAVSHAERLYVTG